MAARRSPYRRIEAPVGCTAVPLEVVTVEKMAAGGDALGRLSDGRVVFVAGAIAGETLSVEITEQHRDYARARVVDIDAASPSRQRPPCPYVAAGCGGCGWQHIDPGHQLDLKTAIVRDALRRTAGLPDAEVTAGAAVPAQHYRTTVRLAVGASGRAGMRTAGGRRVVPLDDCLVAHPALAELFTDLRADEPCEVTLRIGVASGERSALVHPAPAAPQRRNRNRADARRRGPIPNIAGLPDDVMVGEAAMVHETVAGVSLQVSAPSFFQSGTHAAELLVAAVREACGELPPGTTVLDGYGGVGLFGATLGASRTIVVESSASATRDARHNLRDQDAMVHHLPLEQWSPVPVDIVVADPARAGLGAAGVDRVVATGARTIVLVSCDPVSMARDVRALIARDYVHYGACVFDLFPYTSHVEVVTRLRVGPRASSYGDPRA